MESNPTLRAPRDDDWQQILDLADRSVASVPGAGRQDAWLANRRSFAAGGIQRHWVLISASGELAGYAAIESISSDERGTFRVFVVTEPAHLRTLGRRLLDQALRELKRLGAATARFVEYAADENLLTFLMDNGFKETGRLKLDNGEEALVLEGPTA